MCTLREMVNIIVSTKVNNKWVMLIILILFDVNKSHVTIILSDLCIVAVVKYLHNLIKCFELSMDSSCVNLNVDGVL